MPLTRPRKLRCWNSPNTPNWNWAVCSAVGVVPAAVTTATVPCLVSSSEPNGIWRACVSGTKRWPLTISPAWETRAFLWLRRRLPREA